MYECREILNVSIDLTPGFISRGELSPVRPAPTREQVILLQEELAQYPQIENNPVHHFAEGMYGRELPIKAHSMVVGKIHRHEHFVLLLKGTVTINTDRGMETITGPHIWVSPPGAKRALYTHDDCVFFTVHLNPDNSRDLDVIEADVIEPEDLQALFKPDFSDELQRMY